LGLRRGGADGQCGRNAAGGEEDWSFHLDSAPRE
jgi:hypothetical protein